MIKILVFDQEYYFGHEILSLSFQNDDCGVLNKVNFVKTSGFLFFLLFLLKS